MKALLMGAMAAALLASTVAQAQMKPEDMVEARKAGYQFMAWNMGKIKAQVVEGTEPFDQAKIAAAATVISAIANSGMGALYSPETTTDQLGDQTRLKPEFFQNLEKAGQLGREFTAAANQLASVAAAGDQAAIKKAFGDVGGTCKSCHDSFRTD